MLSYLFLLIFICQSIYLINGQISSAVGCSVSGCNLVCGGETFFMTNAISSNGGATARVFETSFLNVRTFAVIPICGSKPTGVSPLGYGMPSFSTWDLHNGPEKFGMYYSGTWQKGFYGSQLAFMNSYYNGDWCPVANIYREAKVILACHPAYSASSPYVLLTEPSTCRYELLIYTAAACSVTASPTLLPTTIVPSATPTVIPTESPTALPTFRPSFIPTVSPTMEPTVIPSIMPSQPTSQPSSQPSLTEKSLELLRQSPSYKVRNAYAFAGLNSSGHVFAWGDSKSGGDTSNVAHLLINVSSVVAGSASFAALRGDGSVVAWGNSLFIQDSTGYQASNNIVMLVANEQAYAGITTEGAVITFGMKASGGQLSQEAVASYLTSDVVSIVASSNAFAALKSDGTVYTWGNNFSGGDVSTPTMHTLENVKHIYATHSSFAALTHSQRVVTWGSSATGGQVEVQPKGVAVVVAGRAGFASIHADYSASSWGLNVNDITTIAGELSSNVTLIVHTDKSFAALKRDGSVIAWGDQRTGGDASLVSDQLVNVTNIYANRKVFVALTGEDKVVVWGHEESGAYMNETIAVALSSGVKKVYATNFAFAALKFDGSVVVWGNEHYGGAVTDSVATHLTAGVKLICANEVAFTAIKTDGTVITWGNKMSVEVGGVLHSSGSKYSTMEECV